MLISNNLTMEKQDAVQDNFRQTLEVMNSNNAPIHSDCSNTAVKREMAEALLSQGLSEDAVCRLLHIAPKFLPENS